MVLGVLFLLVASVVFLPAMRGKFLWRLPAFKEATVSRIASSLTLLMKNGVPLPEAIGLVEQLETSSAAAADLQQWRNKLAAGTAKFSEVAAGNRLVPPLFVWVVSSAGEDLTAGFNRAAEIYHSRAIYRTEVALFSVLPLASLFLGAIVISQAFLVISMFLPMISMVNQMSGEWQMENELNRMNDFAQFLVGPVLVCGFDPAAGRRLCGADAFSAFAARCTGATARCFSSICWKPF